MTDQSLPAAVRELVWNQFGASIDMLKDSIEACPPEVWGDRHSWHEFWYLAFHTLFYLDFYVSGLQETFQPPAPFGMEETEAGVPPPRVYTRDELLTYLAYCRTKAQRILSNLTEEQAASPAPLAWTYWRMPYLEVILYTMRHNQHHAGQLNLLLRQRADQGSGWVRRARTDVPD